MSSRLDEAVDLTKRQLHYSPYYYEFHYEIAGLYLIQNKFKDATYHLERCIAIDRFKPTTAILLNQLKNKDKYEVSNKSIAVLFDYYAETFDDELINTLEYKTPKLIAESIREHFPNRKFKTMYDAGCGTGLCAQACHDFTENIFGVDLSMNMLKQAKHKSIYKKLSVGDITHELGKLDCKLDLITAADVFVYIQDLQYFCQAAYETLAENGLLSFSTIQEGQEQNTGRYSHSVGYIQALAAKFGFEIISDKEDDLRKNLNNWIRGRIYILSKK